MANTNQKTSKTDDTWKYVAAFILVLCILCKLKQKREKLTSQQIITMYGRDSCPYTVQMKDEINNSGIITMSDIKYIDVTTTSGSAEFSQKGFSGVPTMECNGRVASGFMKTSDMLVKLGLN